MGKGQNFLGVLDLRDTLKYVLTVHETLLKQQDNINNKNNNDEQKAAPAAMDYVVGDHSPMVTQTLADLCNHRPFRVVNASDTLLQLSAIFALGSHVVGVVSDNKLLGVCTQGYFFQQIAKRWKFVHSCCLNKIFAMKYITAPIQSVLKTAKAVDAFHLMEELNLSGLAVINEKGVLIHNTSATDIKLWLVKGEESLDQSIESFLINIRNLSLTERYPITVCSLNDTLKRAVQKLQATKYHRLWIVDNDTKPIGVLALTDIFRFVTGYNEKQKKEDDTNKNKSKEQNDQKQQ